MSTKEAGDTFRTATPERTRSCSSVRSRDGAPFHGVGGKDGTYYSLDPTTGKPRWGTNVVFGGFIGTAAFDGKHVFGSTAIGDFGRFERDCCTVR